MIPGEIEVRTDAGQFGIGIGDEGGIAGDAPAVGLELFEIVEQRRGGHRPLGGDDLGKRLADEVAPSRGEEKRPAVAGPFGKIGIGDETCRAPGIEHAAHGLARIAEQIDEPGIGIGGGEERNPESVLRCLLDHAHDGAGSDRIAFAVLEAVDEGGAEFVHDSRGDVFGSESVGIPAARRGSEGLDVLEDLMALAADRECFLRAAECLEEHGAAGPRRRDDEDGAIEDDRLRRGSLRR